MPTSMSGSSGSSPYELARLGLTGREFEENWERVRDEDGFFSLDIVLLDQGEVSPEESRKGHLLSFHALDPGDLCPCGSGNAFGECCQPFGPRRVFVLDPNGEGYSPCVFYTEVWQPWTGRDALHQALRHRDDFQPAESSVERSVWNYKGERRVTGRGAPMSFGTVEATSGTLKIEALSRARYESLRRKIEEASGAELPPGKLHVSVWNLSSDETSAGGQVVHSAILEEYRKLRLRQRDLSTQMTDELLRDELERAAKDLGMLSPEGVVVFDAETDIGLLMDYALFEIKRHGESIVRHFMRKNLPVDEEQRLIYRSIENAFVSVFHVEAIESGVLFLRDLVVPERKPLLTDFGLASTASPGIILYTRLLPFPRFAMTSGWGFAVPQGVDEDELVAEYLDVLRDAPRNKQAAAALRFFKARAMHFRTTETLP